MRSILRLLRGALGTGVTWAAAWALAGLGLFGIVFALSPGLSGFGSLTTLLATICSASGFLAGIAFSTVLATVYRHRQLQQLDLRAIGAWGAGAGLVLPCWFLLGSLSAGILVDPSFAGALLAATAIFGATTASGSVALAQSGAEPLGAGADDPRLPNTGV